MFSAIIERLKQRYRTMPYPDGKAPELSERFLGKPVFTEKNCDGCRKCYDACPNNAITFTNDFCLDLGKCIFCGACAKACGKNEALTFSNDFSIATTKREELILHKQTIKQLAQENTEESQLVKKEIKKIFGKSLKLRQVSAGGCNACEADANVLTTIAWDLSRFGIKFVASPRHADGILVTGPVTNNMRLALEKTYSAIAKPKIVIASGVCAISGGIFKHFPDSLNGLENTIPIDLYIPGCPPHPIILLEGLLRFLGVIEQNPKLPL